MQICGGAGFAVAMPGVYDEPHLGTPVSLRGHARKPSRKLERQTEYVLDVWRTNAGSETSIGICCRRSRVRDACSMGPAARSSGAAAGARRFNGFTWDGDNSAG